MSLIKIGEQSVLIQHKIRIQLKENICIHSITDLAAAIKNRCNFFIQVLPYKTDIESYLVDKFSCCR